MSTGEQAGAGTGAGPWDPGAPGVLRLPSGRLVRGRGLGQPTPAGPEPTFGLYLLDQAPPPTAWPARWVPWVDFGLPRDPDDLADALGDLRSRRGDRVEVACWGGSGRTGTALACLAVLDGLPPTDAIAYVRERYLPQAVETPEQECFVRTFARAATQRTAAVGPRSSPYRIAILASHSGTTAQALMDACAGGDLDAEVALVISNNGGAEVLSRAGRAGVPTVHLSSVTHPDPVERDAAIRDELLAAGADLVVLAGYLKKLGPLTLDAWCGRLVNTHPALLPRYGGEGMYGDRVHAAVLAAGDHQTGASVHEVTAEYDAGGVLAQVVVPVVPGDTVESLGERVRAAEKELLVETIRRLATVRGG